MDQQAINILVIGGGAFVVLMALAWRERRLAARRPDETDDASRDD